MSDYTRTSVPGGASLVALSMSNPITFSPITPFIAANGVRLKDDVLLRTIIGTGITLSAFYFRDEIWPRRDHNHTKAMFPLPPSSLAHNSTTCLWPFRRPPHGLPKRLPIKWLDYPVDYVPPKMDLFSDDPIPFTFSSPFCPIDSEHLERAFETLKYQHAVKTLGVPSVANNGVRIITCSTGSGGTSSSIQWDNDPFLGGFGSLTFLPFEQRSRGSGDDYSGDDEGSGDDSANDEGPGDDEGSDYGYGGDMDDNTSEISETDCLPYIYGNSASAPPPPPPPPSGGADPEVDDDGDFSSLFIWPSLACGCLSGLLFNLYLSLKKRKLEASKPDPKVTQPVLDTFKQTSNTTLSVPFGPAPVVVGLLRDPAKAIDMGSLLDSYCLLQFNSTDVCNPVFDDLDMATVPLSVSWLQASKLVVDAFFAKLPLFGVGCVKMVVAMLVLVLCVSLQIVILGSTGRVRRRGFYSLLKRIFCWKLPRRTPEPATTTADNCEGTRDDGSVEAAEASASVANSEPEDDGSVEAVEASASVANSEPEKVAVTNPVVEDDVERHYKILDTLSNRSLSASIWATQAPIVPAQPYKIPDDLATTSTSTKKGDDVLVQPVSTPTTPSKSLKRAARRRRARKRAGQDLQSTEKESMSDASSDVPNRANA